MRQQTAVVSMCVRTKRLFSAPSIALSSLVLSGLRVVGKLLRAFWRRRMRIGAFGVVVLELVCKAPGDSTVVDLGDCSAFLSPLGDFDSFAEA